MIRVALFALFASVGARAADLPVAPAPRPVFPEFVVRSVKPPDDAGTSSRTFVAAYGLTASDLDTIRKVPGVASAVPERYFESEVTRPERKATFRTLGTVPDSPVARKLASGRFLTDEDNTKKENVCVIGLSVVASLFPFDKDGPIGKSVTIRGHDFRVVGVFRERAGDTDRCVCVPLATMSARFGAVITVRAPGTRTSEKVELNEIVIRATDSASLLKVREAVREALAKDHPKRDWELPALSP